MLRTAAGLALILGLVAYAASGDGTAATTTPPSSLQTSDIATEDEVRTICGTACHAFPPPDILPRRSWRDEIARMALIREGLPEPRGPRGAAGRLTILPPDMERALRFYLRHAPEDLPLTNTWPKPDDSQFVRRGLNPSNAPPDPAVANVLLVDIDGDARLELVVCDMRYGMVLTGRPYDPKAPLEVIAQLDNPAYASMVDLDGDGITDFLIGDLGEFLPADHTRGSVVWLRGGGGGKYDPLELDGWPRVAGVEAADFNGDGTLDLAVAAFGWRKVGNVSILENHTTDYTRPSFTARVIDPRSGSINALPVELNGDGKPDLVALLAQQYEQVVAYINNGTREVSFTPQVIYTAPHPNWGSSGIQVVDLDGDGDLDVLMTHGDTFDDQIVKPYHGIQWLENQGSYPFVEHTLADLPGVSRAEAGDLDGDGDLDIVAGAFIAGVDEGIDESTLPALVWLEQVSKGKFERRTLAVGMPRLANIELGDFDQDGDLDIVTGSFMIQPKRLPWVEIWENRGKGTK